MRKLERYIARYGPETGPKLFHLLQSQAGHASVSARLRRKIATLTGSPVKTPPRPRVEQELPLFSGSGIETEPEPVAVAAALAVELHTSA
jgi:hypothetical protein